MDASYSTEAAPAAIGPYSQAVGTGRLVLCSGQLGTDPSTGELTAGVEAQTERALRNIGAVLAAAGLGYANVVKTTIFLVDIADFATVNAVYATFFDAPYPARSTVGVASLPRGARIEIEALAARPAAAG